MKKKLTQLVIYWILVIFKKIIFYYDLSKQTKLKDPQQFNFIGKIENQDHGATMFFIIEKSEETTFNFLQNSVIIMEIMKTQKIVNLLNGSDNENSKYATKKWYIIDTETNGYYLPDTEIKFLTGSLESSLCDYSDVYILVAGNINVTGGDANTKVALKSCSPFKKCRTEINETFVDNAEHFNIAMPMYNLIEYIDNFSDTSGSLQQFKRDEQPINNNEAFINIPAENSSSFKYKSNFIDDTDVDEANRKKEGINIVVPLKYLGSFWRSLEMSLINCKVENSL